MRQRARLTYDVKQELRRQEKEIVCAVCGWHPPQRYASLMPVHHIIPVAAGGTDEWANLIVLCPNHHALAHALFPVVSHVYRGPLTLDALLEALSDPDRYSEQERSRLVETLRQPPVMPKGKRQRRKRDTPQLPPQAEGRWLPSPDHDT